MPGMCCRLNGCSIRKHVLNLLTIGAPRMTPIIKLTMATRSRRGEQETSRKDSHFWYQYLHAAQLQPELPRPHHDSNDNLSPRHTDCRYGHIGLSVPDVYAACKRFEDLGVDFVKKPDGGSMKGLAFIKVLTAAHALATSIDDFTC